VTERFGPYELLRVVGRGGMGEVLEARDTEHDRIVALKRLTAEAAGDDEYQRRFRREARLVARLRNPHVIPIHRYGEIDGQLFLDMPLVGGADLEQVLRAEGRLAPARAVAVVEQVASALDAAHRAGLVHRDVKPSNVLIDDEVGAHGFVYLVDFGITRSVGGDASAPLTGARILIGSLDYMAPERFSGEGGLGIDVYALACLLFECLTGSRPFPVDDFTELMTAHLYWKPPAPSQSVPGLGEAFDAVIAAGLAKDPEQRPASAGELAAAARAALDARSGTAVPSTPTTAEGPRSVVEPLPAAATRRGGTQKSDAPAPLDVPTTAVPRTSASATTEDDSTTLLPAAPMSAASAAPGSRTGRPPGAPPRRDAPPVRASGQTSSRTGVPSPTGGAAGAGRADARPAWTPDGEDRTVALRVRDQRAGAVPGPAPSGARPVWTPDRESPTPARPAGDPRAGSVPVPAAGPAPSGPREDPTPSVRSTGGRSRTALWVALIVLAAVLVIAAAVYVAVLLTPAAG
jgi:serine/threonine protein kinase